MAFENLQVQAQMLIEEMEGMPEDLHEALERLEQVLSAMRAEGLTPPDDLLKLEADLRAQFTGSTDN